MYYYYIIILYTVILGAALHAHGILSYVKVTQCILSSERGILYYSTPRGILYYSTPREESFTTLGCPVPIPTSAAFSCAHSNF